MTCTCPRAARIIETYDAEAAGWPSPTASTAAAARAGCATRCSRSTASPTWSRRPRRRAASTQTASSSRAPRARRRCARELASCPMISWLLGMISRARRTAGARGHRRARRRPRQVHHRRARRAAAAAAVRGAALLAGHGAPPRAAPPRLPSPTLPPAWPPPRASRRRRARSCPTRPTPVRTCTYTCVCVYVYVCICAGAELGGRARLHDARLPRAPAVRAAAAAHAVRPLAAALQGALPARRARRGRGAGRGGPRGHASVRGPSRPLPRRVRGRLAQQGHGVARLVAARPGGVVARRPPPAAEVRARAHARTPRPPRRVRQPPPPRVGAGTRACGGRRCPRR